MAQSALIRNKERLIRNGGSARNQAARRSCLDALDEALSAVNPYVCLRSRIKIRDARFNISDLSFSLSGFRRIMLLAAGKASALMMRAAVDILKDFPIHGILVVPRDEKPRVLDNRIEIFRARHPIPDHGGLEASLQVAAAVGKMQENELLLCLISGGASAMLPAPISGISIQEKQKVTEKLVKSKATIHEINSVRRHLSSLKGGRLVRLCRASTILSLIISDVPGNSLPDIASGLTVEDPTSFQDAIGVLKERGLWKSIPQRVRVHLLKGLRGQVEETPKPGDPAFHRVHNIILADNRTACMAAEQSLARNQMRAEILTSSAEMEARSMGRLLASVAVESKGHTERVPRSRVVIVGGETTVEVRGKGIGGRSQEAALAAVENVASLDGVVVAALGTDGIDGNSNAAGAIADGNTRRRAERKRMKPNDFLRRNDSYSFFRKLNDNLVTGRTGTNVGDLYLMVSRE